MMIVDYQWPTICSIKHNLRKGIDFKILLHNNVHLVRTLIESLYNIESIYNRTRYSAMNNVADFTWMKTNLRTFTILIHTDCWLCFLVLKLL